MSTTYYPPQRMAGKLAETLPTTLPSPILPTDAFSRRSSSRELTDGTTSRVNSPFFSRKSGHSDHLLSCFVTARQPRHGNAHQYRCADVRFPRPSPGYIVPRAQCGFHDNSSSLYLNGMRSLVAGCVSSTGRPQYTLRMLPPNRVRIRPALIVHCRFFRTPIVSTMYPGKFISCTL